MKRHSLFITSAFCALWFTIAASGQKLPPVNIDLALANGVLYLPDTNDYTKFGTQHGPVTPASAANGLALPNFSTYLEISDVIAVNGQAVNGVFVNQGRVIQLTPTPRPGQATSDSTWYTVASPSVELLTSQGARIGSFYSSGFALGAPPAGAPAGFSGLAGAIQGGTGAFVGATGQCLSGYAGARIASIMEDPANRRTLGGQPNPSIGHILCQLIPAVRPEIEAVYHSDFTPVNLGSPARKGETVIALASGLGATSPGVENGQPFPLLDQSVQTINSPITVLVNGTPVNVVNALGWPGLVDSYRIDFQVPADTLAGQAAIQLIAAWIPGHTLEIPVQ